MNQSRAIRLPVHVAENLGRMHRVTYEFRKQMNREPTLVEVVETLDVEASQVCKLMVLLKKTYSINKPMGDDSDYSLVDTIEDTSTVSPPLLEGLNAYEQVSKFIETFSDAEKKILTLPFGLDDKEPQTLDSFGQSFGVTGERIRQIEVKALMKLRKLMECPDGILACC